jgi:hypothetical protein
VYGGCASVRRMCKCFTDLYLGHFSENHGCNRKRAARLQPQQQGGAREHRDESGGALPIAWQSGAAPRACPTRHSLSLRPRWSTGSSAAAGPPGAGSLRRGIPQRMPRGTRRRSTLRRGDPPVAPCAGAQPCSVQALAASKHNVRAGACRRPQAMKRMRGGQLADPSQTRDDTRGCARARPVALGMRADRLRTPSQGPRERKSRTPAIPYPSIRPPPSTTSPRNSTADWPGVTARCGRSKAR